MAAAFVSVAACLLVVAGVAKLLQPEPAGDALAVLGLNAPRLVVRVGAAVEILVALAALSFSGSVPSILVGASYLGFAGFVALLRRNPDASSCGCFGAAEEPPSLRHVTVNLLIGAGCLVAAVTASPSTASLLREDWPRGLLFVLLSLTAAWLVALVLRSTRWSLR